MKLVMTKFSHHNPTINVLPGMDFTYLKEGIRRGQNLPASCYLIPPHLRCVCVCTRTADLQNTHLLLVQFLELPIPLLSHLSYYHKCWGHFMGMARCLRRAPPKPTLPCASFPCPKMKARRPWSNQCLTILNAQPNVDMDAMIVVLGDLGRFR